MNIARRLGARYSVNLTYRWVAQHTAFCPVADVVGCVLPSCVCKVLAVPGSRWLGGGENKWSSSWGLVLLLSILVSTWIHIRRGRRHSCQRPSRHAVYLPSRGRARWVGGRRWRLSRRRQSSKGVSFYSPSVFFFLRENFTFFRVWFCFFMLC